MPVSDDDCSSRTPRICRVTECIAAVAPPSDTRRPFGTMISARGLHQLDGAAAAGREVAQGRRQPQADLFVGQDGGANDQAGAHLLPRRALGDVALAEGIVVVVRDLRVGDFLRHEHASRPAVHHQHEHPRGARDAGGGVLHAEPAAGAGSAPLNDRASAPLHPLPALRPLLPRLHHYLHHPPRLPLRLNGRREQRHQPRQHEEPDRGDAHRPGYPGICASSGRRSQSGFHSGSVSPAAPASVATSVANALADLVVVADLEPVLPVEPVLGRAGPAEDVHGADEPLVERLLGLVRVSGPSASRCTQSSPWRMCIFSSLKMPSIARTHGPYEQWRTSSSWCPAPRSMQKLKKMKSAQRVDRVVEDVDPLVGGDARGADVGGGVVEPQREVVAGADVGVDVHARGPRAARTSRGRGAPRPSRSGRPRASPRCSGAFMIHGT